MLATSRRLHGDHSYVEFVVCVERGDADAWSFSKRSRSCWRHDPRVLDLLFQRHVIHYMGIR